MLIASDHINIMINGYLKKNNYLICFILDLYIFKYLILIE